MSAKISTWDPLVERWTEFNFKTPLQSTYYTTSLKPSPLFTAHRPSKALKVSTKGKHYQSDLQRDLERYDTIKALLHSAEWMEDAFQETLQFPDDTWGPIGYILNEKKPPVLNHSTQRKYTDMRTSILRYSQGSTFQWGPV